MPSDQRSPDYGDILILQAATAADDNDRMRKVFESKCQAVSCRIHFLVLPLTLKDEERMSKVDGHLKDARNKADEADKQYDEISKKLQFTEGELEKAEERGENGEMKIMELEEELKVVASNLKSLEVSEEKANKREIANKEQVTTLTAKLKQAVARADFAERSVLKLNTEVGIAEDFQTCVTCVSSGIFHQRIQILTEIAGGPFGGGADEGAGEVEGYHRGAGAHLCRTFRILSVHQLE